MTDQSTVGTRLRELMEAAELSENELARRAGVPQPTIHRILKGTSKSPRASSLEKIAAALGTTSSYLAYGDTGRPPYLATAAMATVGGTLGPLGVMFLPVGLAIDAMSNKRQRSSTRVYDYPCLSWAQSVSLEAITASLPSRKKQPLPSGYKAKGISFWLEIRGDAMSAPPGSTPSLVEGTKVLFDTGLEGTPGKLVLAQLTDRSEPTFRKLIEDNGKSFLQPLNPAYPLISLDIDHTILAVAVESKAYL